MKYYIYSVRLFMSLKNTLRRAGAVLLALCMLLPLSACSDARKSTKAERQTVLSIDGFEVPYEQFRYLVCNYMDKYAEGKTDYWNEETAALAQNEIFDQCFDTLCSQYATLSLCREYGVDTASGAIDELVETLMNGYVAQYADEKAYAAALRESYLNDSVYRFFTTVSVCQQELYYAVLKAGDIEADDEKLYPLLEDDTFIRVKQILIQNDPGEDPDSNRQKAEDLRARAVAGEDFDTLVGKYGEDLYMFQNTDGYYICRGVRYKEFEEAAFSLSVGEISDVIKTPAGYSILLRCEKDPAYIEKNRAELCNDYRDACFSLMLERKAASLTAMPRAPLGDYTLLSIRDDFDK